jgi:hypothetical protein
MLTINKLPKYFRERKKCHTKIFEKERKRERRERRERERRERE